MKQHCLARGVLLGLAGFSLAATAATVPLTQPPSSAFADTESAVTYPLAGWDALTRYYTLSLDVDTNAVACVQVAFGTDADADGNLAPEETDFVCGCDCGAWFARDERDGERGLGIGDWKEDRLDLAPVFDAAWNAAKVTTRGPTNVVAAITAQFKNNPMKVVIR